jgi:hypothetical protein
MSYYLIWKTSLASIVKIGQPSGFIFNLGRPSSFPVLLSFVLIDQQYVITCLSKNHYFVFIIILFHFANHFNSCETYNYVFHKVLGSQIISTHVKNT